MVGLPSPWLLSSISVGFHGGVQKEWIVRGTKPETQQLQVLTALTFLVKQEARQERWRGLEALFSRLEGTDTDSG